MRTAGGDRCDVKRAEEEEHDAFQLDGVTENISCASVIRSNVPYKALRPTIRARQPRKKFRTTKS